MVQRLKPGDHLLNKYSIQQELGRGGFGVVFKATDLKMRRIVAIKTLLRSEIGSSSYNSASAFERQLERFGTEAEVSGYFTHNPNIITVYALEEDQELNFYLVLEFIEGGSLSNLLSRQPQNKLSLERTCQIARDICNALQDIHSHQDRIVHRDLKPGNVLLRNSGQAVVADFGIAQVGHRSQRSSLEVEHPLTRAYSSPEQELSFDYLTPISDLYCLGLIIYEMLTGKLFNRNWQPAPNLTNQGSPAWIDSLVGKLLQKTPDERYQTALEVRKALDRGNNGPLVSNDAPRPTPRSSSPANDSAPWMPFSRIEPAELPWELKFPDGSSAYVSSGSKLLKMIAEWLVRERRLPPVPLVNFRRGQNYLINPQPVHRTGREFHNSPIQLSNGLFLDTDYTREDIVENAKWLLKSAGIDLKDLEVRNTKIMTGDRGITLHQDPPAVSSSGGTGPAIQLGWVPITTMSHANKAKPLQIKLPDGTVRYTGYYITILKETVEWLIEYQRLPKLPIKDYKQQGNLLISNKAVHETGSPFHYSHQLSNGTFLNTNYTGWQIIQNTTWLLKQSGFDPNTCLLMF